MDVLLLNNHTYQKGQTLIEVALAIAAATIIITALLTTLLTSMSSAENSQAENEATQYSQQGMELLRAISQTVPTGDTTYYLNTDAQTPLQTAGSFNTPNINGQYIRTVEILKPDTSTFCNGLTRVTVKTAWKDGKCQGGTYCKSTQLVSCVSNL